MEESEKQNVKKNISPKDDMKVTRPSSTSRIAKNTLFLYFRQLLIMLVSLYTVRVVLATLGAEDYGIYNVVAGVVVMFSFVNNAMATSVQRYLTFFIGKNDQEKTRAVFSKSLIIHGLICLIFIFLAETAGLWLLNAKLNIPAERSEAAFWSYQAAVITTLINIIRVPYNAAIIAYEKMSFFAGLSVIEALLRLAMVFLLSVSPFDKLVAYSFLLAAVALLILAVYKFYCGKNFETAHYKKSTDKDLGRELVSFSGWSLFGAAANVANSHGTNIVLNIFTNVTVNAAMGIANQVNAAVYSFVSNFQTAFNPQIVKSWAAGEKEEFNELIFRTSKLSFLLLWFIVLPLSLNLNAVLSLWLKTVPEYSVGFVRLILVCSLVDALNGPLWVAVQAGGKIRSYQLVVSILIFANLPFSILAFRFGAAPHSVLVIRILLGVVITFFRIAYLRKNMGLKVSTFFLDVMTRCLCVSLLSFLGVRLCVLHFGGIRYLFLSCLCSVILCGLFSFFVGFKKDERIVIMRFLRTRLAGQR